MDIKTLREFCTQDESYFRQFGDYLSDRGIVFKDNGSKILAVAHLDYVAPNHNFYYDKRLRRVYNGALDDRLGAYTILKLLPEFGINADILLTTDEEIGQSTSELFETSKAYNWMFQFDRRGREVVTYQYKNPSFLEGIKAAKFKIGVGSFSDISSLDFLECCGMNVGTGYYLEHTPAHYANLNELESNIVKFANFYEKFKNIHFSYTAPPPVRFARYDYDYPKKDDSGMCDICHKHESRYTYSGAKICSACFSDVDACAVCGQLTERWNLIDYTCHNCRFERFLR